MGFQMVYQMVFFNLLNRIPVHHSSVRAGEPQVPRQQQGGRGRRQGSPRQTQGDRGRWRGACPDGRRRPAEQGPNSTCFKLKLGKLLELFFDCFDTF